jgi:transposase-like protein
MSHLSAPHFQDEAAAYAFVEAQLWPKGAVCPHCGETKRVNKMGGTATRIGAYKCYACRKQFTVKVGTVFESSHVPMRQWLQAIYLMCSSKKGISSNQLHRTLGVTLKTAWFMSHRIREAMRDNGLFSFGSDGGVVEVDETFIGHDKAIKPRGDKKGRGFHHKHKVLSLVDRDSGRAKSMVVDDLKASTLIPILRENIAKEATIYTDEAKQYAGLKNDFAAHDFVRHVAGEYGRGEVHTNTIEGYFSIFKRGMRGIYQHCGKEHLHRYLAEFEFRYNNRVAHGIGDKERADLALLGIVGKRLTYQTARV